MADFALPPLPFVPPSPDAVAELHALCRCLPPPPWQVGERYWEVLDARGQIVLRLETPNSRQAAGALARVWNALGLMRGLDADGKPAAVPGAGAQPAR